MHPALSIFLIFLFIVVNGFFSSSEVALLLVSEPKLEQDLLNGKHRAKKVLKFKKIPQTFLSTVQVGTTIVGFITSIIASASFSPRIAALLLKINFLQNMEGLVLVVVNILITLILAYFQVVFGELLPKRIAMKSPEKVAYTNVGFLNFTLVMLKPFVSLFDATAKGFSKVFKLGDTIGSDRLTEEEIRLMVAASSKKGNIEQLESDMIDNIFEFNDTTVEEIMTHRTEVSAIKFDATIDEIFEIVTADRYTRFPVYDESLDQIIGTIHSKDLLKYVNEEARKNFNIKDILREAVFVPDSKKTNELFTELKKLKTHIAIVIDEYGGTAGIVTIEDLLEEIVGNIFDEYDEVEEDIEEVSENVYIIDGLTDLDDVEELLKINLPVDEYDTLSGFMIGQIGRFPDSDEEIIITVSIYHFKAIEIQDKVITSVEVRKMSEEEIIALTENNNTDIKE